jgi:PAS domain S-box-containing protein
MALHAEGGSKTVGVETITDLLASAMLFLPEAVLITAAGLGTAKVVFANEYFQQLTGYSMKEMADRDLALLQGPETDVSVFQHLIQPTCAERPHAYDMLLYKKDGTPFWDRISARRLKSGDHGVYYLQVHSDVSRFKEMEDRLVPSQGPGAMGRQVRDTVHEFNNLLTAIMVYSGLLTFKTRDDLQLRRYAEEITAAAERGSQLAAQLLNLEPKEAAMPRIADAGPENTEPRKATLLLVEDEELVRHSVDAALSMRGYTILPASNAEEAMRISQNYSGEIELMVTDLSMPSMGGVELAQEMHAVRPRMKVLFISGSVDDPRMMKLTPGREGFFRKPFTPAALAHEIEELLNSNSDE